MPEDMSSAEGSTSARELNGCGKRIQYTKRMIYGSSFRWEESLFGRGLDFFFPLKSKLDL